MRRSIVALSLLLLAPAASAQPNPDDDDPKLARATPASVPPDEDDPKLARNASAVHRQLVRAPHPVPRFKLAYRNLVTAGLEGGDLMFHGAELDFYPASHYFRFGLEAEVAFAPSKYDAWYVTTGVAAGVQYPARVTPFIEGRFVAGVLGGSAAGQTAVSYIYTGGLETGIEVYYARRFYVTGAIGWAHPTYAGVDVAWVRAHPGLDPARKEFSTDSLTFKLGVGL
jgi:hypothetical protein